jgi:endo-1,4-beta-xylanase
VFDFADADASIAFASTHGLRARGHPLVWHSKLPSWVPPTLTTVADAEGVLRQHIRTVVGRYSGRIASWNVINEAVATGDLRPDGLRITPWLTALGPAYLDIAFNEASLADPACELVWNEFGLEYSDIPGERKRAAVLRLLVDLKARGVPVHGLGIQSHLNPALASAFDAQKLRQFIAEVGRAGFTIVISELDVTDQSLPADISERDYTVASTYREYLDVVLDEPAVRGVVTWGLTDRHSWLSGFKPRTDFLPVRTLPLDAEMKPKVAYQAMASAMFSAPGR